MIPTDVGDPFDKVSPFNRALTIDGNRVRFTGFAISGVHGLVSRRSVLRGRSQADQ